MPRDRLRHRGRRRFGSAWFLITSLNCTGVRLCCLFYVLTAFGNHLFLFFRSARGSFPGLITVGGDEHCHSCADRVCSSEREQSAGTARPTVNVRAIEVTSAKDWVLPWRNQLRCRHVRDRLHKIFYRNIVRFTKPTLSTPEQLALTARRDSSTPDANRACFYLTCGLPPELIAIRSAACRPISGDFGSPPLHLPALATRFVCAFEAWKISPSLYFQRLLPVVWFKPLFFTTWLICLHTASTEEEERSLICPATKSIIFADGAHRRATICIFADTASPESCCDDLRNCASTRPN